MTATIQTALDAFQLTDAAEVRAFLAAHPFLEPLLGEVAAQLPRYFSGAPLRMKVGHDPEGHASPELILSPSCRRIGRVEAAQDTLDRFDCDWWLDHYDEARGLLLITITFSYLNFAQNNGHLLRGQQGRQISDQIAR